MNAKMKSPVMLAAFAGMILFAACKVPPIEVRDVDIVRVKDGIYEGTCSEPLGSATVIVEVFGGRVVHAQLTGFSGSKFGAPAGSMVEKVLATQSLHVDTVSGATYSCQVILKAFQNALEKGLPEGGPVLP